MRMIDLGNQRGPLYIIDTPTSVDCTKDVGFRRSFRSLVECMVPCCGFQHSTLDPPDDDSSVSSSSSSSSTHNPAATATVTGTFFGYRKGRVSFCIQEDPSKPQPHALLLLEFAVPTSYLAKEMQHGLLRIALECDRARARAGPGPLFGAPAWTMYCNGRRVGFAVRRQMTEEDVAVFKTMRSVSVGAGVLPGLSRPRGVGGDLMYLRARFERVVGSADSESFHMMNPVGSAGQQLSIFLLRS